MDADVKRFVEDILRTVDEPYNCPKCENYRKLARTIMEQDAELARLRGLIEKANATGHIYIAYKCDDGCEVCKGLKAALAGEGGE